jgi:hypothetical protein
MREEEGQDHAIGHATQGKTTKNDGNHKGRDVRRRTGSNSIEHNNANIITHNITITSRETSPSPTRKISRRERVDENIQDISMQQTGQVLQAAGSDLFKNMRPARKYW